MLANDSCMGNSYIGELLPQALEGLTDSPLLQSTGLNTALPNISFVNGELLEAEGPRLERITLSEQEHNLGAITVVELTRGIAWIRDYEVENDECALAVATYTGIACLAFATGRRLISNPQGSSQTVESAWETLREAGMAKEAPHAPGSPVNRRQFTVLFPEERLSQIK